MPLRGLFYFARLYQGYVAEHDLDIYSSPRIPLPTPQYVVLYNGTEMKKDRRELRLSESFHLTPSEESYLECVATVININYGHNQTLMENCRELYEYAYLVEAVRKGTRIGLPLGDAIDQAVETCVEHNVLKEFLLRHRAEVKHMMFEELYSLERYEKLMRQKGYQEGMAEGLIEAFTEIGLSRNDILQKLQSKLQLSPREAGEYLAKFEQPNSQS